MKFKHIKYIVVVALVGMIGVLSLLLIMQFAKPPDTKLQPEQTSDNANHVASDDGAAGNQKKKLSRNTANSMVESSGNSDIAGIVNEIKIPEEFPALPLPEKTVYDSYEQAEGMATWHANSLLDLNEYAICLLDNLSESSLEIVGAGYMDLFGDVWSCLLKDGNKATYILTLQSESRETTVCKTNVTVVCIAVPIVCNMSEQEE
jgi:hypothetical protein